MKTIIFMMGLPASGKSTKVKELFGDKKLIDADKYKMMHINYNPKHPEVIHEWSSKKENEAFEISLKENEDVVVDGTGTNAEKMAYRIEQAENAGFKTMLVYVLCSLKKSIERNAQRERNVPEYIIREKYNTIRHSFDLVAPLVDEVKIVDNN